MNKAVRPVVVVLTGPTCSGKSFLERALTAQGFGRALSHTTREPRPGEVNGVHYHFVNLGEFNELGANGGFVESVQFGQNFYGMAVESMNQALEPTGKMVVVAEPNGAAQIRAYCDDNRISCLNVWVACDHREQVRRFVQERLPSMKPETVVDRLTLLMTEEAYWRKSASVGRVYGAPYRYHMEFWKMGPEFEQVYVEAICERVARIQGK